MATKKIIVSALALAFMGSAQIVHATDVFRLEGYGATSRAMGGVATAIDVGPAGMMTNPATLSLMKEANQVMVGLDLITTDIDVKNTATGETVSSSTHSNNRGPYLAPEVAYTKKLGQWAFGLGAFAQGGLGTEYGSNSFLSRGYNGVANGGVNSGLENSSRLLVLNIPFAASFQVTDKLSIGGSVDAMWQGLNLDLLLGADQVVSLIGSGRAFGSLVDILKTVPGLQGAHFSLTKNQPLASGVSSWGHTERLGLVYKATEDTTLGASYTLKSHMADMEGNATLTAVTGGGNSAFTGKIQIQDFQMPAVLNLGASQRLGTQWTVAADVSRIYWKSVMKDIKVAFQANGGVGNATILLPQDYKDQTILALGTSYQYSDSLTLRGGLRFATQALQASEMFAVIPATPRKHISAGFGYGFSKQSKLDFAWSHAFKETMDNTSLPNTSAPIQVTHSQDSATLNYSYSF